MFKPPSYYVYTSIKPFAHCQYVHQRIAVRTTCAAVTIRGQATWLQTDDGFVYAIELDQTLPMPKALGITAIHEGSTVSALLGKIRETFHYAAGIKINLYDSYDELAGNKRGSCQRMFPKAFQPVQSKRLMELDNKPFEPSKKACLRRSERLFFPFALPTVGIITPLDE